MLDRLRFGILLRGSVCAFMTVFPPPSSSSVQMRSVSAWTASSVSDQRIAVSGSTPGQAIPCLQSQTGGADTARLTDLRPKRKLAQYRRFTHS